MITAMTLQGYRKKKKMVSCIAEYLDVDMAIAAEPFRVYLIGLYKG